MPNNVVRIDRSRRQPPDKIARIGIRIDRDWSIRQWDRHTQQAIDLTQPIPLFDRILEGPASDLDAHPEPEPARHVRRHVALSIAAGTFLLGSLVTILTLAVMLR